MARATGRPISELSTEFLHTLVPIVYGYMLAHYFSLLVLQGQALGYLISDPLGHGSNLFGTAEFLVNYNLISFALIWYIQILAIVGGHVGGIVLSHERGLDTFTLAAPVDHRPAVDARRDGGIHLPGALDPLRGHHRDRVRWTIGTDAAAGGSPTLTIVLPVLAGLMIVALGHFLGNETTAIEKPEGEQQRERQALIEAATPAATGTPAPQVRLSEGATGRTFDLGELGGAPFAVVFTSTRCQGIGAYLGRVARDLGGEGDGDVLVISADPRLDTPHAVRAWQARNHIPAGGPLPLPGRERNRMRESWESWGFNGPSAECPEVVDRPPRLRLGRQHRHRRPRIPRFGQS